MYRNKLCPDMKMVAESIGLGSKASIQSNGLPGGGASMYWVDSKAAEQEGGDGPYSCGVVRHLAIIFFPQGGIMPTAMRAAITYSFFFLCMYCSPAGQW